MVMKELDIAKEIYDEQVARMKEQGQMLLHKNMPKVAGSLMWAKELRDRIATPMKSFRQLDHLCMQCAEAKLVYTKYEEMLTIINRYGDTYC